MWDEAAKMLPEYPNIVVDTSSTLYAIKPGKAKELIRIWTPERVMFGTDYPLWPQQRDIDRLLSLDLSDGDYENIFYNNCAGLFDLK